MNFNELFQKMRELDAPVAEELKGGQKKLDQDKDGDIEADDLKALRDKKVDEELVDECGMDMSPIRCLHTQTYTFSRFVGLRYGAVRRPSCENPITRTEAA